MQKIGEIILIAYDDLPKGYSYCRGQSVEINHYPKLYMMIGNKFGQDDELHFNMPDLSGVAPEGMAYGIAFEGELPDIGEGEEKE